MESFMHLKNKMNEEYWFKKLSTIQARNLFPSYTRMGSKSLPYRQKVEKTIPDETTKVLNRMSKGSDIGRFILILTTLSGLLYRYTDEEHFLLGTTSLNKEEQGGEGHLLFLNNHVQGDKTWRELNEEMKVELSRTFNHQDFSPLQLMGRLKHSLKREPKELWQIACIDEGMQVNTEDLDRFHLVIRVVPDLNQLKLQLEYNPEVHHSVMIQSFATNLLFCLAKIYHNLQTQLDHIDILADEERSFLLTELNQTSMNVSTGPLLHQLLEEQAERTPDNIALVDNGRRISYNELNQKANQLARSLRSYGVAPETITGVMAQPTMEGIIAIVAILKAGGTYCPIDPTFPKERIQQLIAESGIEILLAEEKYLNIDIFEGHVLNLSDLGLYSGEGSNLSPIAQANSLAYVMHTSGSTGKPKGVMVEHRNIVNQMTGLRKMYMFKEHMRHILMAPLTFDPSIQQIFLPLATGGTLYLIPKEIKTDPSTFWDLIYQERIDVINTVPSLMEVLLEQDQTVGYPLEFMILAGETLTSDLVKRIRENLHVQRIINIYGPTEATINTTSYEIKQVEQNPVIPIGKPLANYQVYILDQRQRLLPFGATGELFVAGTGVARGYLNNKIITDEAFVRNLFIEGTDKMYKTGDLARWLPDGNLEFVGRKDQQIKIRGSRVELTEVEAGLSKCPWIKEAVVVHHEVQGTTSLVAFYTLQKSEESTDNPVKTNTIKAFLAQHLPEYMLPAYFVCLDAMPVTANGKIDKQALPIEHIGVLEQNELVEPRNEVEDKLKEVWQPLIGVENIGVHDSFFEVGGNSLSIIRLQSRINKMFQVHLTVPQLFTYHTIALQASVIQPGIKLEKKRYKVADLRRGKGSEDKEYEQEIAVIGMSCRFPLADGCHEFWNNLRGEVDAVRDIPLQREQHVPRDASKGEKRTLPFPQAAYLENIDHFDSAYFSIPPNEARMMEPQQRLFLKVVIEAILDAGYSEQDWHGTRTGVYVGASRSNYSDFIPKGEPSAIPGNLHSVIAGRVSYILNLSGPSEMIDTACSSSLMTIHRAVQEIAAGNCDTAIAGGANVYTSTVDHSIYEMGIASSDGRSKSFDASANGAGGGEGVGAVLLKPLKNAVADGDQIYAVIKGSAANSDGRSNGITAPDATSQSEVIEEAWKQARIDPETISYIEAHGTGTNLGDPIEVEGINNAFQRYTDRKQFCAIGSVKTNIGHLDSAAGIAGFIKTVLALSKKEIPASLHFTEPNPHLHLIHSPVYVNNSLKEWQPDCGIRRAGVSSFGLSGTNCHIVLEEYTATRKASPSIGKNVFTLSARSEKALVKYVERFNRYLQDSEDALADICYCTNISRGRFPIRLAVVAYSLKDLQRKLTFFLQQQHSFAQEQLLESEQIYYSLAEKEKQVQWSSQTKGKRNIYIDDFMRGNDPDWSGYYQGQNRKRISLPPYPFEEKKHWMSSIALSTAKEDQAEGKDTNIDFWQVAESVFGLGEELLDESGFELSEGLKEAVDEFAAQLILRFFRNFGVLAHTNQVYTEMELINKIQVISQYKKLFRFMLNFLARKEYIHLENDRIVLLQNHSDQDINVLFTQYCHHYPAFSGIFKVLKYCLNAYPEVLTGKKDPLSVLFPDGTSHFLESFKTKGRTWGDLYEILAIDTIKQYLRTQKKKKLKVLEVGAGAGTVGKKLLPALSDQQVEYHYTDLSRAILLEAQKQFSNYPFVQYQTFNIEEDPFAQGFMPEQFDIIIGLNVIHATRHVRNSIAQLEKILAPNGALFVMEQVRNEVAENLVWGLTEGWWLFEDRELRTDSPLMPISDWERLLREEFSDVRSFPVDMHKRTLAETALVIGKKDQLPPANDVNRLLYSVEWVEKELSSKNRIIARGCWLIFEDDLGISAELKHRLLSADVVLIKQGERFKKVNRNQYFINPSVPEDYIRLLQELEYTKTRVDGVIHLWTCTEVKRELDQDRVEQALQLGVYSLYFLIKARVHLGIDEGLDMRIISNFAHRVLDEQNISPEKSPIFGLAKVISQEYPQVQCFGLDLDTIHYAPEQLAGTILHELEGNKTDSLVAIRQGRFVQQMTRFTPEKYPQQDVAVRKGGVYIVVGGAGGLGLEISRYLTQQNPIHLVIINRSKLPEKALWSTQQGNEAVKHKLSVFMEMERNGSKVHYYDGDVTNFDQMQHIVKDVYARLGEVNGIIHCAAASGDTSQPLDVQTLENFEKVLSPKIQGTLVLDSIFKEKDLDFLILYSSVASLWGGAGGGDYSAANSFIDSFSAYRNLKGKNTKSINWYAWEGLTDSGFMGYMSASEALEAFHLSLSCQVDQVAIGKFNLKMMKEWMPMMKVQLSSEVLGSSAPSPESPISEQLLQKEAMVEVHLQGKASEPYSNLEREIAQIWAEVLGYEEINIYDNFFEIGGDSLLILKVLSLINETIDSEVEAGDLFSYGSVAHLAEFIESRADSRQKEEVAVSDDLRSTNQTDHDLRSLIKRVKEEEISVDEVMKGFEQNEK